MRQNNHSLQRITLEDFSNLYVYFKKKNLLKKSVNKYGQTLMRSIPEMVTVVTVYCETETTTFPLSTMPSPATTEVKGIYVIFFQRKQLLFTYTVYLSNINNKCWIILTATSKKTYKIRYILPLCLVFFFFPKNIIQEVGWVWFGFYIPWNNVSLLIICKLHSC